MSAVRAVDLRKNFRGIRAVDGVSLTVDAGDILGVIGPNGAGKSTVVNLIAGHHRPDGGSVFLGDENVTHLGPERRAERGLARTFQIMRPFGELTVLENIMLAFLYGSETSRESEANTKVRDALDRVGLPLKLINQPASTLSVGQQRRLEIARALAMRPTVLLLDEPMAGLGKKEATTVIALVSDLARSKQVAVLIVEHVLHAVFQLCPRVLVMSEGREVLVGTPDEALSDRRVVESYLGEKYARKYMKARGAVDA